MANITQKYIDSPAVRNPKQLVYKLKTVMEEQNIDSIQLASMAELPLGSIIEALENPESTEITIYARLFSTLGFQIAIKNKEDTVSE